jgi:hypothetical protein
MIHWKPNVLSEVGSQSADTIKFCVSEHCDERESICTEKQGHRGTKKSRPESLHPSTGWIARRWRRAGFCCYWRWKSRPWEGDRRSAWPIDCAPVSLDQYGQTFAVCSVDGVDVARSAGSRRFCPRLAAIFQGKYDQAQRDAEHAGRGIWEGSYVEPWLFRGCIREGRQAGSLFERCQRASVTRHLFRRIYSAAA